MVGLGDGEGGQRRQVDLDGARVGGDGAGGSSPADAARRPVAAAGTRGRTRRSNACDTRSVGTAMSQRTSCDSPQKAPQVRNTSALSADSSAMGWRSRSGMGW